MTDAPPPRLSRAKRLLFAAVPLILLLVLAEVAIRVTGVATRCPNPYAGSPLWSCDPVLQFKLKPDLIVAGNLLNSSGFRTHEFTPKRDGVFRVLALGDSCTFGMLVTDRFTYIPEPYPLRLERLVAERVGDGKLEVFNAGTPGYNSYQGLMLLRTKLRKLAPDLITVRYGWNDHLMSRAGRDDFREISNPVLRALEDAALRTAIYPFLLRLAMEVQARRNPSSGRTTQADIPKEWKPNVSLEEYRYNLERIVSIARSQGSEVWLLTAPHAFVIDEHKGKYDQFPATMAAKLLMTFSAIPTYERFLEIHDAYNDVVRQVGRELNVPVIDMDAIYREHSSEHLFAATDIPHPTQEGHNLEAETLYGRLVADGIVHPGSDVATDASGNATHP